MPASSSPPGSRQAPPPPQASSVGRAGEYTPSAVELCRRQKEGVGYAGPASRVTGVPAARAQVRELSGAWQAGAASHDPMYGGPAPHTYAPCDRWAITPQQQWPFSARGPPGSRPEAATTHPGRTLPVY